MSQGNGFQTNVPQIGYLKVVQNLRPMTPMRCKLGKVLMALILPCHCGCAIGSNHGIIISNILFQFPTGKVNGEDGRKSEVIPIPAAFFTFPWVILFPCLGKEVSEKQ